MGELAGSQKNKTITAFDFAEKNWYNLRKYCGD